MNIPWLIYPFRMPHIAQSGHSNAKKKKGNSPRIKNKTGIM